MTLTLRILALVLAVQLALTATVGAMLAANARAAVAAEIDAATRAARELVVTTLATLIGAVPPLQLTAALADRLVQPRHARIMVYDLASGRTLVPAPAVPPPEPAPDWFARLLAPRLQSTQLPVIENRHLRGHVVIAADAGAEIAEVWEDARALALLLALAGLAQLALTPVVLHGGLRPLARISAVLNRLAHGDTGARIGPVDTPDLRPLAADVDRLGAALALAQADRARLSRQVVERGDRERQAIARDLHDEYGPCLFALRVEAAAIRDTAADPVLRDRAQGILAIADQIARVNGALLSGLRPMAVGQLPLATVLSDMFADLAERHGAVAWTLEIPPDLPEPDEAVALTIYRILQEGTTNALRHAGASRVAARVAQGSDGWQVVLSDDGRGFGGAAEGKGLSGMRERIALLGGSFEVRDGPEGVTIRATLPPEPA